MEKEKINAKRKSPFTDIFLKLIDGMTQQQVADKVGVSRQNVGLWIKGATVPDIFTLPKIAEAFNVSTDYLLGRGKIKSDDEDVKIACKVTGLSENAIDIIIEETSYDGRLETLNNILSLSDFWDFIGCINQVDIGSDYWIRYSHQDGLTIQETECISTVLRIEPLALYDIYITKMEEWKKRHEMYSKDSIDMWMYRAVRATQRICDYFDKREKRLDFIEKEWLDYLEITGEEYKDILEESEELREQLCNKKAGD